MSPSPTRTLNVAATNPALREALSRFTVFNDGIGVDIASRIKFGRPFVENLVGTDFVPLFLAATRHPLRVYLLGSREEVVIEAARRLAARYPAHKIAGTRNGFFESAAQSEAAASEILDSGADLVLVGMGNPLQELWIDTYGAATGAKALLGVGALFDFVAEAVPRAPGWVQAMRCEWLFA